MLPVGLILCRSLLKQVVVAVITAAAEAILAAPAKAKVKRSPWGPWLVLAGAPLRQGPRGSLRCADEQ